MADLPQPDSLTRKTSGLASALSSLSRSSRRPMSCSGERGSSFNASGSIRREALTLWDRTHNPSISKIASNKNASSGHDHASGFHSSNFVERAIIAATRTPMAAIKPCHWSISLRILSNSKTQPLDISAPFRNRRVGAHFALEAYEER
jgi:hypothetical protein